MYRRGHASKGAFRFLSDERRAVPEPTLSLAPFAQLNCRMMKEAGTTVVSVGHRVSLVAFHSRVLKLGARSRERLRGRARARFCRFAERLLSSERRVHLDRLRGGLRNCALRHLAHVSVVYSCAAGQEEAGPGWTLVDTAEAQKKGWW